MKYITRIDHGRTHGFYVRIPYPDKTVRKLFSDLKNGSKEAALEKAIAFRDATLAKRPHNIPSGYRKQNSKNKSGVTGVCVTKDTRKGKKIPVILVTWNDPPGTKRTKKFWPHHYEGDNAFDQAFEAAVAFRKAIEATKDKESQS